MSVTTWKRSLITSTKKSCGIQKPMGFSKALVLKWVVKTAANPVFPVALRLSLPAKPPLNDASLGGTDYAELSSKYKAIHVKVLIWWVAFKCQRCADGSPGVPQP